MASNENPFRDKSFGVKLDFLEGIIGHIQPAYKFRRKYIAKQLKISPQQLSRKLKGNEPISNWELAKLIDIFELNAHHDFRLLKMGVDQIETQLRKSKIGVFAGNSTASAARKFLLERGHSSDGKINLIRRPPARRTGGLGLADEQSGQQLPTFHFGDQARMEIPVSKPGHLCVLNDQLRGETTCLMPSLFAPDTAVVGSKGIVRVPTSKNFPYFDVMEVEDNFRIFSIWTPEVIKLPWIDEEAGDTEPAIVVDSDLVDFVNSLKKLESEGGYFTVYRLDYRVIS